MYIKNSNFLNNSVENNIFNGIELIIYDSVFINNHIYAPKNSFKNTFYYCYFDNITNITNLNLNNCFINIIGSLNSLNIFLKDECIYTPLPKTKSKNYDFIYQISIGLLFLLTSIFYILYIINRNTKKLLIAESIFDKQILNDFG